MVTITNSYCEDRLTFDYHLRTPWGMPDIDGQLVVRYEDVSKLPAYNAFIERHPYFIETVRSATPKGIVALVVFAVQETEDRPLESLAGPYREVT